MTLLHKLLVLSWLVGSGDPSAATSLSPTQAPTADVPTASPTEVTSAAGSGTTAEVTSAASTGTTNEVTSAAGTGTTAEVTSATTTGTTAEEMSSEPVSHSTGTPGPASTETGTTSSVTPLATATPEENTVSTQEMNTAATDITSSSSSTESPVSTEEQTTETASTTTPETTEALPESTSTEVDQSTTRVLESTTMTSSAPETSTVVDPSGTQSMETTAGGQTGGQSTTSAATSQTTEESESTTTEVLPPVQGTTTSSATSSASTTTEASSPSTTTVQPPAETSTMTTVETTANTNTVMQSTQSTTMVEPTMTVQSTASTSTVEVESTASMTTAVQSSTSTTMVTQSSMNGTTPETRPTTPSIDPCTLCPRGSTCVNSTCQCLPGTYLVPGNPPECDDARVFPGDLRLNRTFQPEMADQSSQQFRDTAGSIIRSLNIALRDVPGYINSTVTQLRQGSVIAAVQNIFQTNLEATENSTTAAIQQAITSCTGECGTVLSRATFNSVPLCDLNPGPCSAETTECGAQGGRPSCTCKGGFVSNAYSRHTCIACPSGQRAVGDECVWCAFGYSGFNCNDSSLLAVVVISCVLGGLLLILILALIIYYCITCRRNKQQKDCHSPYTPDDFRRSSWTTQGITPIPRATINPNASLETSLEMTEGGSTHSLVSKRGNTNGLKMGRKTGSYDVTTNDNLGTFKGKNPSRYSYLVQGHENPYFIPGDENKST
ncbi:mucin-5AC isoform X6 [Clupea harengus]|uniref:Mucin-5AC isoform X6 n=1 Tax=Clupea harengus TaxID=7950 RepID=A0A6P8FFL6_CLUHA|nr:mucin-5AC isoform X6 [Clupea harengus]